MKKYRSKISPAIAIMLWTCVGLTSALYFWKFEDFSFLDFTVLTIIIWGSNFLIVSILTNTHYRFEANNLKWTTGPFSGKIPLNQITRVARANSLFEITGIIKPCLTTRPLLLRYEKYEDLAVSPQDEESFIAELKKWNPEIKWTL